MTLLPHNSHPQQQPHRRGYNLKEASRKLIAPLRTIPLAPSSNRWPASRQGLSSQHGQILPKLLQQLLWQQPTRGSFMGKIQRTPARPTQVHRPCRSLGGSNVMQVTEPNTSRMQRITCRPSQQQQLLQHIPVSYTHSPVASQQPSQMPTLLQQVILRWTSMPWKNMLRAICRAAVLAA